MADEGMEASLGSLDDTRGERVDVMIMIVCVRYTHKLNQTKPKLASYDHVIISRLAWYCPNYVLSQSFTFCRLLSVAILFPQDFLISLVFLLPDLHASRLATAQPELIFSVLIS